MVAFPYRLPSGFAGQVTRSEEFTGEAVMYNAAAMPGYYGAAIAIDTLGARALVTGDVIAAIAGFLVRPFPTTGNLTDGIGVSTPQPSWPGTVMKRGYMIVKIGGATVAAKGGAVWVRKDTPSAGKVVGDVEAAADGLTTLALANCYFMGPADATGMVEIAYNI